MASCSAPADDQARDAGDADRSPTSAPANTPITVTAASSTARDVDNDRTVALLARIAVSQADAGADIVAPSDMMDGRVAAIRAALDTAGHINLPIMSYAAKYASAFYGPFREAAASMPAFGDRRSHQMDPANAREALTEIAIDLDEGADIVIVKPALAYLDVIRMARDAFDAPIAGLQRLRRIRHDQGGGATGLDR